MKTWLRLHRVGWMVWGAAVALALGGNVARAQEQDRHAQEIVRVATQTELKADADDHSQWMYRDIDGTGPRQNVSLVIETSKGSVKKKIEANGQRLPESALRQEDVRIQSFVNDPGQQAKRRRDSEQDDKRATSMLKMLPEAFLWTVKRDSGDTVTLAFVPDPKFEPPTMESRVFAAMAGEIVVNKPQNRIQTVRGRLTSDVKFAWGLLGKMNAGGTFAVERRELAPGVWQITESHVHIDGHALLFKTISEHDDEVKSDFKRTPPEMTLERAAEVLKGEPQELSAQR